MKNVLSRGSEWRKWDLHVHTPGTRFEDKYDKNPEGDLDWKRFCRVIHDSDVSAIGITDYFSFDRFFEFKEKYSNYYRGDTNRVFFPNLELRLNHAVHKKGVEVNIHLILPPTLNKDDADRLLHNLKLFNKAGSTDRNISCAETKNWSSTKLESASTTLDNIREAIMNTFDGANSSNLEDYALILASGRDDGISPGTGAISPRKEAVIDIIDQGIHALFSRGADSNYWLKKDRISSQDGSASRPTFGGCDAHDFEGLEKMLGETGADKSRHWETTWIKADLSWDGLLQTLAEPESRVSISELKPDTKNGYRTIKAVEFYDNEVFPERLVFNQNLNAIIGSRSSGKSSLLAHIAYAVNPKETKTQQSMAKVDSGPAAGLSWTDVPPDYCRVIWNGESDRGKVVYIPQNYLNRLSNDPRQVTKYILPSVRAINPVLHSEYESLLMDTDELNSSIELLVAQWFDAMAWRDSLMDQITEHGDKKAIEGQIELLDSQIKELRKRTNITEEDAETYRKAKEEIAGLEQQVTISNAEIDWLKGLLEGEEQSSHTHLKESALDISITFRSSGTEIPSSMQGTIEEFVTEAKKTIEHDFLAFGMRLLEESQRELATSSDKMDRLRKENALLFERFKANTSVSKLEEDRKTQNLSLDRRQTLESKMSAEEKRIKGIVAQIVDKLRTRESAENAFVQRFNEDVKGYEGLDFSVDVDYVDESLFDLLSKFDRSGKSDYISGRADHAKLDISKIQGDIEAFLTQLKTGNLKIKRAENPKSVAQSVLTKSRDVRFLASLDGDTIGGFQASTMTPGKQSLFALTLILSDAGEDWPLLIDQPEDDLDSRSIYCEIVEFLKKQKKRRQILMVTHNANLVVGADAECVIVANRHGDDRRNANGRTFDYFSGSLENSAIPKGAELELERQGIREHVVELLDGGSEAFKKRKNKYKL